MNKQIMINRKQNVTWICLLSLLLMSGACHTSEYQVIATKGGRYAITANLDQRPDTDAVAVLMPYKAKIDSMMAPVIGESALQMEVHRPEGLLPNLVANVLREAAEKHTGQEADIGLVNMGALRASLPAGKITLGNLYRTLPFENNFCIITLSGGLLKHLFHKIAANGGFGISGARIVITEGKATLMEVNGRPIDDKQCYRVATIDYLAEGNDGMTALALSSHRVSPEGITLRELLLNHTTDLHRQGKKVTSVLEGRIIINETKR